MTKEKPSQNTLKKTKKRRNTYLAFVFSLCSVILYAPFTNAQTSNAQASPPPILVEMFSSTSCTSDQKGQKDLMQVMKKYPNAILLNCRTAAPPDAQDRKDKFEMQACSQKSVTYFQKLGLFAMKSPQVIVNGKYEASNNDFEAALKLGQAIDKIETITLEKKQTSLDFKMPKNLNGEGVLYLYIYAPSEENTIGGAVVKTETAQTKETLPQSVPFEGAAVPYQEIHFRPLLDIIKISDWSGKEKTISHPLNQIIPFIKHTKNPGFVGVLYSGNSTTGDVLAIGELKPQGKNPLED